VIPLIVWITSLAAAMMGRRALLFWNTPDYSQIGVNISASCSETHKHVDRSSARARIRILSRRSSRHAARPALGQECLLRDYGGRGADIPIRLLITENGQ
jgi:hypothetical protein